MDRPPGIAASIRGRWSSLETHSLVVAAMKRTGRSDFDGEWWSEPFEIVARDLRTVANLHHAGRFAARRRLIDLLSIRARATAAVGADHTAGGGPDQTVANVLAPVFVAGFDHAGAEVLHRHLARADGMRALHPEEVRRPERPLPSNPLEGPAADDDLLATDLAAIAFEWDWWLPGFAEWLDGADLTPAYLHLGSLLRLRQSMRLRQSTGVTQPTGAGNRWVLRSAQHLEQLGPLAAAFPDATVVVVRPADVAATADAVAAAATERQRRSSDHVDADRNLRYWRWRVERMIERVDDRRGGSPLRVLDVATADVAADPAGVAAAVLDAIR